MTKGYIFHKCRTTGLPKFKLSLLYRIFLLGVIGYVQEYYPKIKNAFAIWFWQFEIWTWYKIYVGPEGRFVAWLSGYIGIEYSSRTLASAVSNFIPAFTFILAVIFRFIFFLSFFFFIIFLFFFIFLLFFIIFYFYFIFFIIET